MTRLLPGNSGSIAPPNLATNGAFLINQRGLGVAGPIPATAGDYLTDCWKVSESPDYLTFGNWSGLGGMFLVGHGKKGQKITIESTDLTSLSGFQENSHSPAEYPYALTASLNVSMQNNLGAANTSVPMLVSCQPQYEVGVQRWIGETGPSEVLTASRGFVQVTAAIESNELRRNQVGSNFSFVLLEDGEFVFKVENFSLFAGAFKNPPKFAPVPYADDLVRCQRYYQTGKHLRYSKGVPWSTTESLLTDVVRYSTPMVASPSLGFDTNTLRVFEGNGTATDILGSGAWSLTAIQNSDKEFCFRYNVNEVTHGPKVANNGLEYDLDWTAEVV